jgi:hypothetical protein
MDTNFLGYQTTTDCADNRDWVHTRFASRLRRPRRVQGIELQLHVLVPRVPNCFLVSRGLTFRAFVRGLFSQR